MSEVDNLTIARLFAHNAKIRVRVDDGSGAFGAHVLDADARGLLLIRLDEHDGPTDWQQFYPWHMVSYVMPNS